MHTRSNLHILYAIFALMIAQAHCNQFMCYICEDCSQVNTNTPKQACDETFFKKETTLPPTITTDPTTEKITTTTVEPTETTISSTQSTNPPPPTPPTIGPVETTTALPTPPNPGTVEPINVELVKLTETATTPTTAQTSTQTSTHVTDTTQATTILEPVKLSVGPAEIRMRQLRSVYNAEFTYHCYSVQEKMNGTTITSRGCSRIGPKEAVCTLLKEAHNNTEYSSCTACSNTLCNSSSAVGASIMAIILGLAVAFSFKSTA